MPGKPKNYTHEFKEQAVKKVVDNSLPDDHPGSARTRVNDTTLGFWVKAYRKKTRRAAAADRYARRERVRELERRDRELEMENAFLKKAAAYFAREHR